MDASTHPAKWTHRKSSVQSKLILAMSAVYLLQFFAHSFVLDRVLFAVASVVFLISLPQAKTMARWFGIGMFAVGLILTGMKENFMEDAIRGMTANLPLLILVILVPLMSIPLKADGYFSSVHYYMRRISHRPRLIFSGITLFLSVFGPILNMGALRVLHEMIKDLRLDGALLAKAYLVGFSTVILWSPYFASVALVLYYLQVPIAGYFPLGLALALIQLVTGNVLYWAAVPTGSDRSDSLRQETEAGTRSASASEHRANLGKLVFFVMALMALIFILEYATHWPMMYLVTWVSIGYPAIWMVLKRKYQTMKTYWNEFESQTAQTMNNEIVMFLSAGLFGSSLSGTAVAKGIQVFLNEVSAASFLLFIAVVMSIILLLTFVGIHQIVVITTLVTQMNPETIGARPEALALLLMVSWSASAVLSPINPLNLLVSGFVGKSSLSVGLRLNGIYLLTMLITGAVLVYSLH